MKALPDHLIAYNKTPTFNADTIPSGLMRNHKTKPGVWAVITVFDGELELTLDDCGAVTTLTADQPGVAAPEQPHHVTPLGPVNFQVKFYR